MVLSSLEEPLKGLRELKRKETQWKPEFVILRNPVPPSMAQERATWAVPKGVLKARMCPTDQAAKKAGLSSCSNMKLNSTGIQ